DGIRDGHVTGVQTCALPISPYKPGSRGFGLYPRTTWWWGGELARRDGLYALKIHRGKTVLVTTAVAELADGPARAALMDAEAGKIGRASCRERGEKWCGAVE